MHSNVKKSDRLAIVLLCVMVLMVVGSIWNDSAIVDELAHIPAGFGYLHGDFRLNPEHPPLIKTASALFAHIFARPYFPLDNPYWTNEVNGQWDQGVRFLYGSGNDADKIIFWARIPVILLGALFGWLLYR